MARRLSPQAIAAALRTGATLTCEVRDGQERTYLTWDRDDLHPDDWAAVLEALGLHDGGDAP